MTPTETDIIIPDGVTDPREFRGEPPPDHVTVVNDTGLPDQMVEGAVQTTFVENASLAWGRGTTFQTYAAEGSLLARRSYRTPGSIVDEVRLARELAEKDDDIGAVLGQMVAIAFGEGMQNQHRDEKTVALFDAMARNMGLDLVFQELYRELLISSQVNTATLFTRENLEYTMEGGESVLTESVACPLTGVIPAEQIRVLGNDMFRTGVLAYEPDNERIRRWLDEFFDPTTTPARKAEMGRQDRVSANMFTGVVEISAAEALDPEEQPVMGGRLYTLNPRMVKRTTYPKGSWKYPRPLLTRNFALLEAKRLLNIMDYALLQGGSSFIVVAKKGSDERPAQPAEITNLQEVVRRASKTGIIVGDHRLDFDIITPKLDELLKPEKRRLIGRKLAMAMLRLSEHGEEEGGSEGIKSDDEMTSRVVMSDRKLVTRHVEAAVYAEAVTRNKSVFIKGHPSIWTPKIVLQGTDYFTDYILKLRDRGDIPRAWGVEFAGFNYEAAIEQRRREVARGDDDIMVPASVPHSTPESGPQDNNEGRPSGGADDRPTRRIGRNQGETIKAWMEQIDGVDTFVRMGEQTCAVLEQFPDRNIGRVTTVERAALSETEETAIQRGATFYVPVNAGFNVVNEKAVRLRDGMAMIVGEQVGSRAIVAKMLCFREPDFTRDQAEEYAVRWGFSFNSNPEEETAVVDDSRVNLPRHDDARALLAMSEALASAAAAQAGGQTPVINVEVHAERGRTKKIIMRDDDGNIIGSEEIPVEDDPEAT